MPWICGVEEAGRGPVLGPMAMAICWVREEDEPLLREAGARDSKLLTPSQREGTLERIEELRKKRKAGFELVLLSPEEIDAAVEGDGDNLNKLELRTSAMLINKAIASLGKERLVKALIDCPTKNTAKYAADIKRLLKGEAGKRVEVIAEHKADVTYPVVSAASIVAKVNRDREIARLKERTGKNFGSGYPADPLTQEFLRNNYWQKEYDGLFRKSWASYKAIVEASKQRSLFQFGEGDERDGGERDGRLDAEKAKRHAEELKKYEFLQSQGFSSQPPTNPYEVVRLKSEDATVIVYTTGKVVVQGKGKARVERLLKEEKAVAGKDHSNI